MFQNNLIAGAAGQQGEFYPTGIEQSLRFNDDDSAYLSRTPSSAGNRKTWTWSSWIKRGNLGTLQMFFCTSTPAFNGYLAFGSDDTLTVNLGTGASQITCTTSAKYRDTGAWYHVQIVCDTSNGTEADRLIIYVNGERQARSGSVTLNHEATFNSVSQHEIGRNQNAAYYFDGYMAEVNFIDGLALDPTSFGEFKSDIWIPKEYSGSYGTNGFYLPFSDSAAIGDDLSGNTNDWTVNNLVATDVVLDSPTNNFATLSPIASSTTGTFKNANLEIDNRRAMQRTSFAVSSGQWYMEARKGYSRFAPSNSLGLIGITDIGQAFTLDPFISLKHVGYYGGNGNKYINQAASAYGASYTTGDIIGVAVDMDAGDVEFFKNNVSQGVISLSTAEVSEAVLYFSSGSGNEREDWNVNFGQDSSFAGNETAQGNTDDNGQGDFYYTPPAGFLALCTANLPDPAIDPAQDDVPADYFNTVLYTGNGSTPRDIGGVGFQPDWVWIKERNQAGWHRISDAIRGSNAYLSSNTTNAEDTTAENFLGFTADGFTVGSDGSINGNTDTYVAWNWLAGNGTASNTNGDLTSTVSVNLKSGVSIVSYDLEATGIKTVGHSLGVAPKMIITKSRSVSSSWVVYHAGIAADAETDILLLNLTSAATDNATAWNDTAPTDTVFTLGSGFTTANYGTAQIAYCFAEVEGFSKFGSYTGNGSADGPFVYCGFRPAFVMVKRTDSTGNWVIEDAAREPYNDGLRNSLYADLSNAEDNDAFPTDFLSNGFKHRNSGTAVNTSGGTYIFMAFAEAPFKYSNAR